MGWLFVIFVIAPCTVLAINLLFFPRNGEAEKRLSDYINNSVEIELYPEDEGDFYFKIKRVYTGLRTAFLRGKLTGARVHNMIFYNNRYQKYFSMSIIPEKIGQFDNYYKCAIGKMIIARVNRYELGNEHYGTPDNPIPIFMLEIPAAEKYPDFLKVKMTEEQYRRTVLFYLTYMMPKKEFKERFENGKESDFHYEVPPPPDIEKIREDNETNHEELIKEYNIDE